MSFVSRSLVELEVTEVASAGVIIRRLRAALPSLIKTAHPHFKVQSYHARGGASKEIIRDYFSKRSSMRWHGAYPRYCRHVGPYLWYR